MEYSKEQRKDTPYVSVDRLFQKDKYRGLSIVPSYATEEQPRQVQATGGPLSAAPPGFSQGKLSQANNTSEREADQSIEEVTKSQEGRTSQPSLSTDLSTVRNIKTTIYTMTPDAGLGYINNLIQNNKNLSKAGQILSYTDLASSALNITTLGIIGYISALVNNETKLVKDVYDDLRTMYIAAWPATNMTWTQFNDNYRLEITYISYQERGLQDIGYKKIYTLQEVNKGRSLSEIAKDDAYLYQWVDQSVTIARFVNVRTGDYLTDSNGKHIQAQLFEGYSLRTNLPVGKEYLEENSEVRS